MRRALMILAMALTVTACRTKDEDTDADPIPVDTDVSPGDTDPATVDADDDGVPASDDCDDTRADVYPGADELCDGVDNDCDGVIDPPTSLDATTWYDDADGDRYGDGTSATVACTRPAPRWIRIGGDCDDGDRRANPDAEEVCDGIDNDCDTRIDVDATDAPTWYPDLDRDGFGDTVAPVVVCEAPALHIEDPGDCNDTDPAANPDGTEVCNGADDDCDGTIDQDATDALTFHADTDGDGFGNALVTALACTAPPGFVVDDSDCDDGTSAVRPSADETCNTVDDDCDGAIDEPDAIDAPSWFADTDGDGFGDPAVGQVACDQPFGFVVDATDCDDDQDDTFPGADEICNGVDDDCDAQTDEPDALDAAAWYDDVDLDGFGDPTTEVIACDAPVGTVDDGTDCDDTVRTTYPGAPETCDGTDNDCDGAADDDPSLLATWFRDADGDGVGVDTDTQTACAAPAGYVAAQGDCNDADADTYPGADETCDAADRNCDGDPTARAIDATTWYLDADGDGVGGSLATRDACTRPTRYQADDADCDDADATAYPGAPETCDGADDDCNGLVDDDPIDEGTWYVDADSDGFGDPATAVVSCTRPPGTVSVGGDCNDLATSARPGGTEICDGLDNDCDGDTDDPSAVDAPTFYADTDGDGFGDDTAPVRACSQPAATATNARDCDDDDDATFPGAPEVCDGLNQDCDGVADDAAIDATSWYADGDGDGVGNAALTARACAAPTGFVATAGDCDDGDASVLPGADETCDGDDEDCDGTVDNDPIDPLTFFLDADGDTWGVSTTTVEACQRPAGYAFRDGDCDDTQVAARPGGTEVCDGLDNDCNGTVDGADAAGATAWYADLDADGAGDPDVSVRACVRPTGFVASAGDCDDDDDRRYPGYPEVCDGLDNDCVGATDPPTSLDAITWFVDLDGDGAGSAAATTRACTQPAGFAPAADDCNDASDLALPGGTEVCDGLDNDCNGATDEASAADATAWTLDLDGDGHGVNGTEVVACAQPSSVYAAQGDDCDDTNSAFSPSAPEVCDDLDHDCDGDVDFDGDGDGWSDITCGGLDCDDAEPTISPDPGGGCALGADCLEILSLGRASTDGVYTIDPDGYATGEPPFDTRCDMTRYGGGWTLVGTVANDGVRRWNSLGAFTLTSSFGDVSSWQGSDYKNPGFTTLASLDLLVQTPDYDIGWTGLMPATSIGGFLDLEYDTAQCSEDFLAGPPDLHTNLTADQVLLHDVVVRARDSNATCFPGTNENALLTFTLSSCCWTNGLGNTPGGQAVWRTHDLSMLSLANLVPQTCTPGSYPCNPAGRYHSSSFNSYDTSRKVPWAAIWTR